MTKIAHKKYRLAAVRPWLLKDEASVRRHVRSDDYFGTIATVLSLLRQQMKKDGVKNAALLEKTLANLERDLVFLQRDYNISRRPARTQGKLQSQPSIKKRKMSPKGKLRSQ